ncbi:MAG: HlyD family type I secretion periplasmic adaptor subunit [Rickettsiaceae bacterium]|nr:HlyD family type I secretion periplasmic adaptor subunit [Rickettsiaceae bacterium]
MNEKSDIKDQKQELTAEQKQKLQQLQALMMQQIAAGKGGKKQGVAAAPQPPLVTKIFIGILQKMTGGIKLIDRFINLIVKKDGGDDTNDVIKSARSPILFGIWVTLFFFVFGFLWAAIAPLDSAAVAIGTVISQSKKQNINQLETGIIKEILVAPGDKVEKGDKLIIFDDVRTKATYQSILNQYRTYSAIEARLIAELNQSDEIIFPDELLQNANDKDVARILETQVNIFNSKKESLRAAKDLQRQKIQQLYKKIDSSKARATFLNKNLEITQDRLEATRKLNTQGYSNKSTLLEFEARLANIESEIAMNEIEMLNTEQEISKSNIELLNIDNQSTTEVSTELNKIQAEMARYKEELSAATDSLERTVVKAPISGVINNLNYHTVGSIIPGGQNILEIAPLQDKLIIEAKVAPRFIASISAGMKAKIKFSAFKSRTAPTFYGVVISLSPDLVIDMPQAGQLAIPQSQNPETMGGYYSAKIEIDMDHFNKLAKNRDLTLVPGMQAEVQIITGTRTLLQYLLDPVYDAMFKGFKEK